MAENGQKAIVTRFYSGNVGILERNKQDEWVVTHTTPPFDEPNYAGNPRHLLIDEEKQIAYISNLGRNLVHIWSIIERQFVNSLPVG